MFWIMSKNKVIFDNYCVSRVLPPLPHWCSLALEQPAPNTFSTQGVESVRARWRWSRHSQRKKDVWAARVFFSGAGAGYYLNVCKLTKDIFPLCSWFSETRANWALQTRNSRNITISCWRTRKIWNIKVNFRVWKYYMQLVAQLMLVLVIN